MEPREGPLLQSKPPGVNTQRNAELENSSHPPTTEMLESCLPDIVEAAKPSSSVEEIMEIPERRGSSPVSTRVPHASLEGFHENEPKPDSFGATGSSSLPRFLWGEQMSEFSDPLSCPSGMNGAFKASRYGKGRLSNSSSSCSTEKFTSTFASLELNTETSPASILDGITELLRWGNRKPRSVPNEVGTTSGIRSSSLQADGKLKSVSASELGLTEEKDDEALLAMFSAVANSRLAVQSQQMDEPDFTPAQKLAILRDLYHTKPLVFLERFRTVLHEEHLACFHHLSGNYEADFYCAEVRRAGVGENRHTRVRNKRYAALQQLIRGGDYFSDEQMRSRDPLLYEQYIGQYLSHEELQALDSCKKEASCSFSGLLLDSYQEDVIQRRLQVQQEQEEAAEEEEEDSSSEDDEDKATEGDMDEWTPDQEEKTILREEFTSRMYQRFLDGKDKDFDYSEVDENPDFDNLDIVSRDEEERYFDEEEEEEEADAMEAQ